MSDDDRLADDGLGTAAGVETVSSAVGVEQMLAAVLAELERRGLDLFAVIDHSGEAVDVGLALPDTKVVIFGNPKGGTPLMVAHPLVALDLPLKLLLSESAGGHTFVAYNAPEFLAARYGLSDDERAALGVVGDIARVVSR